MKFDELLQALTRRLGTNTFGPDSNWQDRIRIERLRQTAQELGLPLMQEAFAEPISIPESTISDHFTRARLATFLKEIHSSNDWLPSGIAKAQFAFVNAGPESTGVRHYSSVDPIVVVSQFWLSFLWDMTNTRFSDMDDEGHGILCCLTLAHYASVSKAGEARSLANPHAALRLSVRQPWRCRASVMGQTKFMVAHELGHVLLNEENRSHLRHLGDLIPQAWLRVLQTRASASGVPLSKLLTRSDEIEADVVACELCLGSTSEIDEQALEKMSDVYFLMWCCHWLEKVLDEGTGIVGTWYQRLFAMRAIIKSRYPWAWPSIQALDDELGAGLGPGAITCKELFPGMLQ